MKSLRFLVLGLFLGLVGFVVGNAFAQSNTVEVDNTFEVDGGPYNFELEVNFDECTDSVCTFTAQVVNAGSQLQINQVGNSPYAVEDLTKW